MSEHVAETHLADSGGGPVAGPVVAKKRRPIVRALFRGLILAAIVWAISLAILSRLAARQAEHAVDRLSDQLQNDYGRLPAFSLQDQDGRPFTDGNLDGKMWVVDFFYSRCTGICPLLAERMKDVERGLDALHVPPRNAGLISITADPEHDHPAELATYARDHAIDTSRWHLLTGPSTAIEDVVVRGFKLAMGKPESDPTTGRLDVLHASRLVLVDGNRNIRGYYDGDEAGVKTLIHDLSRLQSGAGK